MGPTFIRIFSKTKDCEILININAITEIQVEYAVKGEGQQAKTAFAVGYGHAKDNPNAFRVYTIFVGGTKHTLVSNPGSPVMQVLEDIYKNSIKHES